MFSYLMIIFLKSKLFLQVTIAIAACVPVFAGVYGVINNVGIISEATILNDNHIRYLSGLLLAIGLAFWSFIPKIETKTTKIRLLTFIVFVGGLSRAFGTVFHGELTPSIVFALTMELIITPLICFWQKKISQG